MGRGRVQLPSPRLPLRGSVLSSHIGACVGFPLYRRSHFGEFRRPDVAPEESSLARILLEVHGFEHTIPGVHVEKEKKKRKKSCRPSGVCK